MNADAFTTKPSAEVIRDQLAALVFDFNLSSDPVERSELHVSIVRLRRLLEIGRTK